MGSKVCGEEDGGFKVLSSNARNGSIGATFPSYVPIIEVLLTDGKRYSEKLDYIKGHPQNPMDFDECVAKFRHCAAYSERAVSRGKLEEVIALIDHLETVEDLRSIIEKLI